MSKEIQTRQETQTNLVTTPTPDLPLQRTNHSSRPDTETQYQPFSPLCQIQQEYLNWPQRGYPLTFKQALALTYNNRPTSNILKDKIKVAEIKKTVTDICQRIDKNPQSLFVSSWVTDYSPKILSDTDQGINFLTQSFLKELSENYPDESNSEKRLLILNAILQNKLVPSQSKTLLEKIKENNPSELDSSTLTTLINQLPPAEGKIRKKHPKEKQQPTPPTDTEPTKTIIDDPIYQKAQAVLKLKQAYQSNKYHETIDLLHAIRLIHSDYRWTTSRPKNFRDASLENIKQWFKKTLPELGIKEVDDIDVPFTNTISNQTNPDLIPFIRTQLSEGQISFEVLEKIVKKYSGEKYFSIQRYMTEVVINQTPTSDQIDDFIDKCVFTLTVRTDDTTQRYLIQTIYENYARKNGLPIKKYKFEIDPNKENKDTTDEIKTEVNQTPSLTDNQDNQPQSPKTVVEDQIPISPTKENVPQKDEKYHQLLKAYKGVVHKNNLLVQKIKEIRLNKSPVSENIKWWTDPKFKIPQKEQDVFEFIAQGGNPYQYAKENQTTYSQVIALLASGWNRQNLVLEDETHQKRLDVEFGEKRERRKH